MSQLTNIFTLMIFSCRGTWIPALIEDNTVGFVSRVDSNCVFLLFSYFQLSDL